MCVCAAAVSWCQEPSVEGTPAPRAQSEPADERRPRERPIVGRVTELNPVKGYIELESLPAGTSRVIVVTDKTEMTKPGTITAAELQVGDVIRLSGIPLQLEAASIDVQPPSEAREGDAIASDAPPASAGEAASDESEGVEDEEPMRGEAASPGEEIGRPGERRGRPERAEGTVSVSGVVQGLDPLVVALSSGLSVTVALTDDTVVTKPVPATIEDVNEGDFVWATGERNPDELLEAERMRILPPDSAMSLVSRFRFPMMERPDSRRSSGRDGGEQRRGGGPPPFGDQMRRERREPR